MSSEKVESPCQVDPPGQDLEQGAEPVEDPHAAAAVQQEKDRIADKHADPAPEQPYTLFSTKVKYLVVFMASFAAFFGPFGVNIYLPVLPGISKALDVSSTQIMVSVTLYMVLQGTAPPFWGPIADSLGRRPVLVVTFLIFLGATLGLAFTNVYWLLLVLRMVQAFGATSAVAIGAGCISDVSQRKERGSYMGFYSLGLFLGPTVGPVIGGAVAQRWGWHAVFFFLAGFSGTFIVLFVCVMPETLRALVGHGKRLRGIYRPLVPMRLYTQEPTEDMEVPFGRRIHFNLLQPWLALLQGDMFALVCLIALFNSGYYLTLSSLSNLLDEEYTLNLLQNGLCYIPSGIGCMIGSVGGGKLLDYDYRRQVRKYGNNVKLNRVRLMQVPAFLITFCVWIIVYGWLMQARTNLAGPLVFQFLIGLSCMASATCCNTLIVDMFTGSTASVMSTSNIGRSLTAAGCVAFVQPMLDSLNPGWSFLIIGLGILALGTLCWIYLWLRGQHWIAKRERKDTP